MIKTVDIQAIKLVSGEWFIVEQIDFTNEIVFGSDEDGDEKEIAFSQIENVSAVISSVVILEEDSCAF